MRAPDITYLTDLYVGFGSGTPSPTRSPLTAWGAAGALSVAPSPTAPIASRGKK
jgi:hypothetical protein